MADETQAQLPSGPSRDERLEQVLAEYLRQLEQGANVDQQALLAAHPDLADDLREFFGNQMRMQRFAAPLMASVPPHEQSTFLRTEAAQVGLCIGPYTLVQRLGEGGMGEVWVAKQSVPIKRKVALKLIRHGSHSKEVLTRFEHERQALAMMDHPNIAKVFDGGATPSGQPYFVMELVNGLPLTKYCDEARLTLRERMQLFLPICQAVQHAHQKGIIHRDLKPSNILVTIYDGQPVPKVIDFGVAKATGGKLTDDSMSTQFGAVVGTLEYMSPEQTGFHGQDVDTRADIYSLGVILYELLTGLRPMDGQRLRKVALAEMIRVIQEDEPSKPSTRLSSDAALPSLAALRQIEPKRLTALLRGELDWVVMKCLEKSRDRRYETANGLARDIQHYLADEPVEARPPSARYRLSKFLRRNKGPVLAASLLLLALIVGIIGTTWGLVREAKQRQIAESNEGKANDATKQERLAKEEERIAKEKAIAIAIEERKQRDRADENFKSARRHLYAADMYQAQVAWDNESARETIRLLDLYRPETKKESGPDDLRGFEWYYWNRLCRSPLLRLKGATSVAFSPDWTRLASVGVDGVKVWDATSGMEMLSLKGHTNTVYRLAFSPDGKRLAAAVVGGVKVWDVTSGQDMLAVKGSSSAIYCVVFSPDGKRLAAAGYDQTVRVWDATSGQETLKMKGHNDFVLGVAFSPDGKRLASASRDQTVKVWDATSGQEMLTLKGHTGPVQSVAFSPDAKRLVSASDDQTVKVWDAIGGHETLTLKGHFSVVWSVAFSPDGNRVASASWDNTVKMWDATSGQEMLELKGHTHGVRSVAFSPDGNWLAAAGGDEVKVWDATIGEEPVTLKGRAGKEGRNVVFSPDGKRLASASEDQTVKVWDATTGQATLTLKGVSSVAFSPNGKWVASAGDEGVKVRDITSGQEVLSLKQHTGWVTSVAFSPDGNRLVSTHVAYGKPGEVKVWDTMSGQEILTLKGNTGAVRSVAYSPDGKRLATAEGGEVKVWDATSGKETLTLNGHTRLVWSVAFSPDGKRLALASGVGIKVWDATSGQEILVLKGRASAVYCVAFSPDGKRLASASEDQTVKVWDAKTGQETLILNGHTDRVWSVAFSPDGHRLASASWDGTVKIWDARPWTPELRAEQQAIGLIRFLRTKPLAKPALLEAISADATISEPVRQRALELARDW